MEKEKIVVILLLATIILSIASIAVTFSLNFGDAGRNAGNIVQTANSGNVNFVVTAPSEAENSKSSGVDGE